MCKFLLYYKFRCKQIDMHYIEQIITFYNRLNGLLLLNVENKHLTFKQIY